MAPNKVKEASFVRVYISLPFGFSSIGTCCSFTFRSFKAVLRASFKTFLRSYYEACKVAPLPFRTFENFLVEPNDS